MPLEALVPPMTREQPGAASLTPGKGGPESTGAAAAAGGAVRPLGIDILGIRELKWTGMGEFNSDDHFIYYCGHGMAHSFIKLDKAKLLLCLC